jgi:hypothetical protein
MKALLMSDCWPLVGWESGEMPLGISPAMFITAPGNAIKHLDPWTSKREKREERREKREERRERWNVARLDGAFKYLVPPTWPLTPFLVPSYFS